MIILGVSVALISTTFLSSISDSFSLPAIPISIKKVADGTYSVYNNISETADSFGYYYLNFNNSGWNYIDVYMNKKVKSIEDQLKYSKSMGYLEGYVTCKQIQLFWPNFYSAVFGTSSPGYQTIEFIETNYLWLEEMSTKYYLTDNYWYSVKSTLEQVKGVYEGYTAGCATNNNNDYKNKIFDFTNLNNPTLLHFLLINAWGDLYQITTKFKEPGMNSRLFGNKKENKKETLVERCSAIIKLLPDNSDVIFGHATWDSYESLGPRIIKHYSFTIMNIDGSSQLYDTYFSSSPALLSSVDDFYITTGLGKLGVIETTNSLYNVSLLTTGSQWAELFSKYHSGTYTNQWMVLDFNLFSSGSEPSSGFLTVLEEVPGLIHYEDKTNTLIKKSYWGSYNSPVYNDIAKLSGYLKLCDFDINYCHDTAPRANIFREYHTDVDSISGGEWILSYNSFQNDTFSLNNSCNAIACRGDLEPKAHNRGAYGALDAKVSSVRNAKINPGDSPVFTARIGPTHSQQAVFCWSQLADESEYSHGGQPDCYPYEFQSFPPEVVSSN